MRIKTISSRKILDSSSGYTIETEVMLSDESVGIASVAGGLSRGAKEADSIPPDMAVNVIKKIKENLIGPEFNQKSLDEYLIKLDGTANKSKLGGNTILSISIAFLKASAISANLQPYEVINKLMQNLVHKKLSKFKQPDMMMLMLEGGLHGDGSASIQEFMAIVDDLEEGVEIYNSMKSQLKGLNKSTNVGVEGAFSPQGLKNEDILDLLSSKIKKNTIALDIAASSFRELKADIPDYQTILDDFPVTSIEDPYPEDDLTAWHEFSKKYGNKINVVTDDLTVTNPSILLNCIKNGIGNTIIIKPNQIGTIWETLLVTKLAKENGWETIVSHRGTDSNDDFIADLAIGISADYVKFGAPARGERVAKYNRLSQILDKLNL